MLASVFFMETPICNAAAVAASTAFADDYSEIYVPMDVARKLERERDEAREAADNLVEYARQSLVELEKWGKGYARYERQMNEIRVHIARVNWKEGAK